jgi:signal transduction histidine kinase
MDTHFAPAERLGPEELRAEVAFVSSNPILTSLLTSVHGLLAVLSTQRQILAVNEQLARTLKIDNAQEVLGLRPGETLRCVHADEMPGGCGTSTSCSTCGAVIAMVTSLTTDRPTERDCAITTEAEGKTAELFLRVRCVPVTYEGHRLLLLFLQDITQQQKLAALERVFYHDINGLLHGLTGAANLVLMADSWEESQSYAQIVDNLAVRLSSEVAIQRALSTADASLYQPTYQPVTIAQLYQELQDLFRQNGLAEHKALQFAPPVPDVAMHTEPSLLLRVLRNMITNALEATPEGGEVKVTHECTPGWVAFRVWNRSAMPPEIVPRIFQRNFSTKVGGGRGLGTYSMKFFGEQVLQGVVDFTSSDEAGTVFCFRVRT